MIVFSLHPSYKPSGADSALLTEISASVDGKKYPHVARWLNQITSFTSAQRAAWGGVAAAAKPAAAAPAAAAPAKKKVVDDDDFGLSSSDDDEETKAIIAKKAAERAEKNKGKPAVIARSSVILFVKPLESETNMDDVAAKIKAEVVMDGLQWGDYELVPIAFGIKKLRIICVIEDEKIALDDLTEAIEEFEEVQSVDIDAFNKL